MPMMTVLQKMGLYKVIVIVTRYFGGTLLGAGGLVRAYTASAKSAVETAGVIVVHNYVEVHVEFPYQYFDIVRKTAEERGFIITEIEYSDIIKIVINGENNEEVREVLMQITNGQVTFR